jgi:hypothetical protein
LEAAARQIIAHASYGKLAPCGFADPPGALNGAPQSDFELNQMLEFDRALDSAGLTALS